MESRVWHRSYAPGVPSSVEYREKALPELVHEGTQRWGDAPGLRFMNAAMDYGELGGQIDRLAAALMGMGLTPGTRVAIQMPNLPQTVLAFQAVLRAGGIAVMTNPLYTPREIEHQWNDAGCEIALVMDFLYADRLKELRDRVPVKQWIVASIPEYLRFPLNLLAPLKLKRARLMADVPTGPDVHRFRELVDCVREVPTLPDIDLDSPAALQYTGGTTGVSKGAVLTHRNLSYQAQQLRAWLPEMIDGREVFLAALPFFHVFGLTVAMSLPLLIGAQIVLLPNPREIKGMIDSINRHRVTIFPIVPAMVNAINTHPHAKKLDVTSLKMCVSGSAPLAGDTLNAFEALTGGRIVEGYGLTEASPVTHVNPNEAGKRKIGHIGLPLPDTDCRIVSAANDEEDVPPGEPGELLIRGPQVMRGYWNRPGETAGALRDGWLYTGDLATVDDEGYFRIVGRKKEMIVAGGYNIYPDEVDRVLIEHPDVLECATIGVPCERRGETVKSFVVLRTKGAVSAEDLTTFCRERLAAYKIPREIEFREELPKSSVLKILRRELVEEELRKREAAGTG